MLYLGIAVLLVLGVMVYIVRHYRNYVRVLKLRLKMIENRLTREKEEKHDYQSALGLPWYRSPKAVEDVLWARAYQGDEVARDILGSQWKRMLERKYSQTADETVQKLN